MNQIDLSVIILCYREGKRIRRLVEQLSDKLNKAQLSHELVLVANYSPGLLDETPAIVRQLASNQSQIRAVTKLKQPNQGLGWDVRQGMALGRGKVLTIFEGDEQTSLQSILDLYGLLQEQHSDLVKAVRVQREDGWVRILLSRVYNAWFKVLWPNVPDNDVNAKPKMITRSAWQKMRLCTNGWFIDAEIMLQAMKLGLKVGSTPVVWRRNTKRPSYINWLTILEFCWQMVIYRMKSKQVGNTKLRSKD
jgi:glycosyltransferase involved in cell wall biosynthesis